MTQAPLPAPPPCTASGSGTEPAQTITGRLATAGFGVHGTRWRDRHELTVLNATAARSCLTLTGCGWVRWHYEPAPGPGADAATLAAIIVHILGAPHMADSTTGVDAYRAFPLKGAVGRCLQDRGLTVTLRVCEDWESFEATTDIEVSSPARPWLGAVRLADNGHLDWECDYRATFHGDPGQLADMIAPILRAHPGTRPRRIPLTAS
ncbi:MAG: hypothetical protein ABSF03_17765 [Streptosporangiaceae bacterium]